ncbi:hypothetical protein ACFQS3_02655 [Glycomyces mayteni]|uniref:Uncharacterized protein n=1 Tax=Glycomyces mayteni TaxID=543887 RepID=A0ABW2D3N5_9ACTN|nr:hypothetical protein GCM10025732_48310 [Glycomyces mayteni]
MDIVYPVGPGDRPWLRHSLRSLVNLPHDRVYVVGELPDWVNPDTATHLPTKQFSHKWQSSQHNLLTAANHPEVSDDFVLMNDDFFVTRPIAEVPTLYRGDLAMVIAEVTRLVGDSEWVRGMRESLRILTSLGIERPRCYAMHVPMVLNKTQLAATIRRNTELRSPGVAATDTRTMYGNLNAIGGSLATDPKSHKWRPAVDTELPFMSSAPSTWGGPFTARIRAAFPQKCAYER